MLAEPLPKDRDPQAVYANNELELSDIDVYGFDYDYTVACYSDTLDRVIYDMGRENLMKYNKVSLEFLFTVFGGLVLAQESCIISPPVSWLSVIKGN